MRYWNEFLNVVNQKQAEISISLAHGNASDYAAYMKLVGIIEGLEMSKDIVHSLLQEDQDE